MSDRPTIAETRTVDASFEMRDDDGTPTLEGYAATFNTEYDLGVFRERIEPSAFNRTLSLQPDVRLLVDHEGQPLARTKSGTLELSPDATGLHVRARLEPADPDVQRLLPKMRRGDLDQMSFAFRVPQGGDVWSDDFTVRTLREINLSGGDVSVVTYPANPSTSAAVRATDVLSAQCTFVEAMMAEKRLGRPVSRANQARLAKVLPFLDIRTVSDDTSFDNIRSAVADALADKLSLPADVYLWVADLSDTWVVYNVGNDYFRVAYTMDDTGNVTFSGDPVGVVQHTTWDAEPEANSGRPLGLALAVVRRLDITAA